MAKDGSIGWIGPSDEDTSLLRHAAERLLSLGVDQVVYLGEAATLEENAERWSFELGGDGRSFLDRVAGVAENGTPAEIASLLESERAIRTLSRLRTLPPLPTRAVEMLAGRIILAVRDKKVLDEEDIANATIIVYGNATEWLFKRFGPRYFLTPGPLAQGRVAILGGGEGDDSLTLSAIDVASGEEVERHVLQGASSRMTVSG